MNFGELLWWYLGNVRDYATQMLPCMCAAAAVYALALPARRRRLDRLGLVSPLRREIALLFCMMFGAGLAALTLFPANFWHRQHWLAALRWERPLFPHWGDIDHILQLVPLQEIRRAVRGPWVMFLMVANIGIFLPVGVFSALLWRKPRWWKSLAVGFNGHRIHSIFHRAQRRRGRRAAEHRRGPVGLLAVLAGPGPVPPADRRVPMP